MNESKSALTSGLRLVGRNKRYIFWFWLLNLALAWFGGSAFRANTHAILDHSLYSDRLLHGFDLSVMWELIDRPEFGSIAAITAPAIFAAFLFLSAVTVLLPGVFQGYASTYRLPREEFFRACGRNLWRIVRLTIVAGIVMSAVAGILFAINSALVEKAGESTNELLPFRVQTTGLVLIFLLITTLRIWFDLAAADIVLNDERTISKSIRKAFRHTFHGLGRLLLSYLVAAILGAIILLGGIRIWMKVVRPENVAGAFVLVQLILLLLLIPRFWQRGVAVSYWQQTMNVPAVTAQPAIPAAPPPVADESAVSPTTPAAETSGT